MEYSLFYTTVLVVLLTCQAMAGEILPSIHWSTTNPAFKSTQVHKLNVMPSTSVNIICPTPSIILSTLNNKISDDQLYENFLIVDKEGFDSCTYDPSKNLTNRYLKRCNEPKKISSYNLVFSPFSSTYGGLEFTQGKDYYFIATSDGTSASLDSKSGGHCNSDGLKMKFQVYICISSQDCETRNSQQSNYSTPTSTPNINCPQVSATADTRAADDGNKESFWMPLTIVLVFTVILLLACAAFFIWKFSKRMKRNEESSKEVVEAVNTIARNRNSQLLETLSQGSFNMNDLRSVSMYVSDPNMNGTLERPQSRPQSMVSSPSNYSAPPYVKDLPYVRDSQYTTNSSAGLLPYTSPKGMEV